LGTLESCDSSGTLQDSTILLRILSQNISQSEECLHSFLYFSETNILIGRCEVDLHRRIRGGVLHITPWFCRLWWRKPQGSKRGLGKRDSQENSHRLCKSL
jgi:hypothetical protein